MLSNSEFTEYMNRQLSQESFIGDPKYDELQSLWSEMQDREFSKEEKIIADLHKKNNAKFDTLKNIISTELKHTKELKKSA